MKRNFEATEVRTSREFSLLEDWLIYHEFPIIVIDFLFFLADFQN